MHIPGLTEPVIDKHELSSEQKDVQSLVDQLVHQATDTGMIVNGRKTKEMLIGPVLKDPPPSVSLSPWIVSQCSSCWECMLRAT